jgi:hypothetical protein
MPESNIILISDKEKVLTRRRLRREMEKKYGAQSPELSSLFEFCAEVAESEFMKYWLAKTEPTTVYIALREYNQYQCPSCKYGNIKSGHRFCCNCGHSIRWR